jgi:hypothetical protein
MEERHGLREWKPLVASAAFLLFAALASSQHAVFAQVAAGGQPGGQTPGAVMSGSARLVGPYDPNRKLRLVFGLQPPHMAEEEQFLRDLHTKGSPEFHRFLTAEEWNARFAPLPEDEQAVVDWAQAQGFTVTQRYPNRLLVDVEAPVAVIQKALQIAIHTYQAGAVSFFSNDRDPVVPAHLSGILRSVQGLNSLQLLRPAGQTASVFTGPDYVAGPVVTAGTQRQSSGDSAKLAGAAPGITNGAYDPPDLYSSEAYDFSALHNLGHCCNPLGNPNHSPPEASIAIATAGYVDPADIAGFQTQYPYLAYNFQSIYVDGVPTWPEAEGTLDAEWATAMANSFGPDVASTAKVYVYAGPNALLSTFTDIFNQMLTDGNARVLSTSWGCAELYCYDTASMDTVHAIFNQMVGQGWTLVGASGDGGATADCTHASVLYPASDPNVVAAGGTSLSLNLAAAYNSEFGWTGGTSAGSCSLNDGGSGGGISAYYATPPYQANLAGDTGYRSVPDLSLNAGYPQNVFYQGLLQGFGGTSIAAPELAGFFAQANAYLLSLGDICGESGTIPCAPMGNANYYLYNEGINAPYALHYPFYDITSGCNSNDVTNSGGLPYYCAATGYDRVTGWGSANMLQLAWAINTYLAGDFAGPTVAFSGPALNQWYNTDQTVGWTMADRTGSTWPANGVAGFSQAWDLALSDSYSQATPGSGNSFYSGPQFANAAGGSASLAAAGGQGCHTVHVEAWDNAGVPSGDQTYGPLCYDTAAPAASGTLTPPANAAGWNNTAVQVALSASDPGSGFGTGSGIAAVYYAVDNAACGSANPAACLTYSTPFSVTGEASHSVYVFAKDKAGNAGATRTIAVKIDQTAPLTTATLNGSKSGAVYTGPVQVTLSATDILSGVLGTVYQLDGGSVQAYAGAFTVPANGSHTVTFHSTDNAGNVESAESISFTISSAYLISGQVTLGGNGLGNVTVALSGTQAAATTTSASGTYSFTVSPGGSYTVTPSLAGYSFSPTSQTFNNVSANQTANFTAAATGVSYMISGQVTLSGAGFPGVTMSLTGSQNSSASTDSSGNYSFIVLAGGNYTVTPSLAPYNFSPPFQTFNTLSGNQTANFAAGSGPPAPALVSPASGATGVGLTAPLTWAAAAGATSYDVYFGTSSPPPLVTNVTGTSYSPGTLLGNSTYYWFVVAKNGLGSAPSATWSFTTGTCTLTLSPTAVYLDGANQTTQVTVKAAPPSCNWSAATSGAFLAITSGAAGTGNGAVGLSVPANLTGTALTGSLTAAGQVVPVTQRATVTTFADVKPPDYYFDFAGTMYTAGITAGCSASPLDYCPGDTVTRGQMAVFLVTAALGTNTFTYTTTPYFTDVAPANPFFKFIQKLRDLGITSGCSATEFCPDDPVTRGQMATFIIRARYETTPYTYPATAYFTDVPASYLFFPFIQKMAQAGITAGCAPNLYCPDTTLTRGQMAVLIVTGLLNRLLPAGTSLVAAAAPNSASPGQAVTATLTGVNTHFAQGTTQVSIGPGITATNVTVTSATSLTVEFAVAPGAAAGPYSIVATTGSEEAVLPNGFTVP